jgi:hypothetical protein
MEAVTPSYPKLTLEIVLSAPAVIIIFSFQCNVNIHGQTSTVNNVSSFW